MITPVVLTMKAIGYQRAMVFHALTGNGFGGIDELSPVAESYIAELHPDGSVEEYTLLPETTGLCSHSNIQAIGGGDNPQNEALRLLKVFTGNDKQILYETICLNTAPIFYIANHVADLKSGVDKARAMIDSGAALEKLRQWVCAQHREPKLGQQRINKLLSSMN